ncbi:RIBOSOME ASSEMBLY FACTOR MRT4 [Salix viminalis]|uniref:Ribosome assembly factor mrt4 n=1 Tax=Salix viminalis TaxID=40686 RepID=A0A9Q0Z7H2_SALVM|nr:RIBOSOME ASSEMBLY FACTOR MRT4 [Salix viminalis]
MQVSLGRSDADEIRPGLHKVSKLLHGDSGLFLTNLSREEVERLFNEYEENDFARTGTMATEMVELKEGPLEQFTHEMEPFLRKQGLPVRLNKGVIELVSDFVVCEEGKPLSPESARILRLLGTKMATFRLHLICRWSPEDFELYREGLDESVQGDTAALSILNVSFGESKTACYCIVEFYLKLNFSFVSFELFTDSMRASRLKIASQGEELTSGDSELHVIGKSRSGHRIPLGFGP